MALVQEYNADVFRSLRSPEAVVREFKARDVESLLRGDVCDLFTKHQIGAHLAVEILHRHFDVPPDKRLVKVGRVVTPWSTALIKLVSQGLGKICPEAVHVHNGAYYPYEFVHLSNAEAATIPGDDDGFGRYSAFLEEFARFVEERGIAHVLGLRLLTNEERSRAQDPGMRDYEVTDGGDRTITLSTDLGPVVSGEFLAVSWVFINGVMKISRACFKSDPCMCGGTVKETCDCDLTCQCAARVQSH